MKPAFAVRAADRMKAALSTWTALFGVLVLIAAWMMTDGFGYDAPPWIGLNLILSCFAALQCFVLLIAGRRAEQIAAQMAVDAYRTGQEDLQTDRDTNALLREVLTRLQGSDSDQSGVK